MDSDCSLKRIVVLWVVLAVDFLHGGVIAFQWNLPLSNGSTLHRCAGDDVTFRWSYVTEAENEVLAVFLFSRQNGTLVRRFSERDMTSSERVTFLPPAGMTLTNLTSNDTGRYGIHVLLFKSSQLHTQVIDLVVTEPPRLRDAKLVIEQHQSQATTVGGGNETLASAPILQCGHFLTIGNPPASIKWSDPDKRDHVSTVLDKGHFLFNLPAFYKGGNYTCTLVLVPEVSKCIQSDLPFAPAASIFLETTETKLEEQVESLQQLKEEVVQVKAQTSAVLKTQSPHFIQEIRERLRNLENGTESLTLDLDRQRESTQMLNESSSIAVADLRNSFQNALAENEAASQQSLQDTAKDLLAKLGALQKQFQDQRSRNDELHGALAQQKAATAQLQENVLKLQEENEQQKKINSDQQATNSAQLKAVTDLQSNQSAMAQRIEELETLATDLQSKWRLQQQELEAQKATSEEQERISSEFLPSLAAVQKQLGIQMEAIQRVTSQLRDHTDQSGRKLSALQNTARDVKIQLDQVSTKTSSDLESLGRNMNDTRTNLTSAVSTIARIQQNVADNLDGSVRLSERLTSLEKRVNAGGGNQPGSLTSQVALLKQNVSMIHRQYQDVLPRVVSLESGMQNVDERLHPVRLVGGRNALEGRVEIRVGNRWGTVCDDDWDSNDARVVCNMLGYFAAGAIAKSSATFGQGTGPIILDDVDCDGNEQDLRVCDSRDFGTHNCGHNEDAGVVCAGF